MRVMVLGSGGREHALVRALVSATSGTATSTTSGASTPHGPHLACWPANPGIATLAEVPGVGADLPRSLSDAQGLALLASRWGATLVIPGPEASLVAGVADALAARGIACCGPSAAAARLEGSKAFCRELAQDAAVPSPHFTIVDSASALRDATGRWEGLPVIKADGLAGGKGVLLPDSKGECIAAGERLLAGELGDAGRTLVLEERLVGVEASVFFACHGDECLALPHARDHKRLLDADLGPNTGGMGAISPNPLLTEALVEDVRRRFVLPTLRAMERRGAPFVGFLFVGLMLTNKGPKLLEYNVRLGDPEAQAILPRLSSGALTELCWATAKGKLDGFSLEIEPTATCAVVLAASGYPGTPRTGDRISIAESFETPDRWLVHAGTACTPDGHLVTAGGRVATVVARAATPEAARKLAYEGVAKVHFEGLQVRDDIGTERTL